MKNVVIHGLFRPPRGGTIDEAVDRIGWADLYRSMRSDPGSQQRALDALRSSGLSIESQSLIGFVASAPLNVIESLFQTHIQDRTETMPALRERPGVARVVRRTAEDSLALTMPTSLESLISAVALPAPTTQEHDSTGPVGAFKLPVNSIVDHVNMSGVHLGSIDGTGVHVVQVDTGFTTLVKEWREVDSGNRVTTEHPVRQIRSIDPAVPVVSFSGRTIQLSAGWASTEVEVVYACLHPSIAAGSAVEVYPAATTVNPDGDQYGHGVGVGAYVLAMAPGVKLDVIKSLRYYTNSAGDPAVEDLHVPGLIKAVGSVPDVIVCPWTVEPDPTNWDIVEKHLMLAYLQGTVVVAASSCMYQDVAGSPRWPLTHPTVISAGGAFRSQAGSVEASKWAGSFESVQHPSRRVPDVVGLMAGDATMLPYLFPTQENSTMDNYPPTMGDGWVLDSGTSTTAAQVAGLAACIRQKWPNMSPLAVKNVLTMGTKDVVSGESSSHEQAGRGWDPATGWGLIDGEDTFDGLGSGFLPRLRAVSLPLSMRLPFGSRLVRPLWSWLHGADSTGSPDIIVRRTLDRSDRFGITTKHQHGLSEAPRRGESAYVLVRVDNRGVKGGTARVRVSAHEGYEDAGVFLGTAEVDLGPGEFIVSAPVALSVPRETPSTLLIKAEIEERSMSSRPHRPAWLVIKVGRG